MELSKADEPISGLVPGNPKMKINRTTAERLLSQFDNLHLLIEKKGKKISMRTVRHWPWPGIVKTLYDPACGTGGMLSNPPFGVDWKKARKIITDEHKNEGFAGRFGAGLPRPAGPAFYNGCSSHEN